MLNTVIRESATRMAEAPAYKQPITAYASDSTGAQDYRDVAGEWLARTPQLEEALASQRKSTLPYNPVADRMRAMITGTTEPAQQAEPEKLAKPSYLRASFQIPEQLLAEVRDAVIALSGPPDRLTMARFAEEAFRRELKRLQAEHHDGRPFETSDGVVRVGRPVGWRRPP
jgi:hypothetical protein